MSEITEALNQRFSNCTENDRVQVVAHIEELFERFLKLNLQDNDFISEVISGDEKVFQQRYWEMFLGCWLVDCGFKPSSSAAGPDFKIEQAGQVIWLEAICPGPGDGDNLIPQPEMKELGQGASIAVYSVPHEETLLRWTSAIATKAAKFQKYLDDGLISEKDCCIIAVNASLLGRHSFIGISQCPFPVEATYAIGPQQVPVNVKTGELGDSSYVFRPEVKTVNGVKVDCDVFLEGPNQTPLISGVLGTQKKPGGCVGETEWQMALVKNPFCTNPLQEDIKISNEVYSLKKVDEIKYQLICESILKKK